MTPKLAALPLAHAHRTARLAQDTAKLTLSAPDAGTLAEAAELGRATMERAMALQAGWVKDWADWMAYAQAITEADTVPKFAEHAGNIALRAQAQMTQQMTALSELSENVTVSYGYWLSKQTERRED